jgi:hypothetical protein
MLFLLSYVSTPARKLPNFKVILSWEKHERVKRRRLLQQQKASGVMYAKRRPIGGESAITSDSLYRPVIALSTDMQSTPTPEPVSMLKPTVVVRSSMTELTWHPRQDAAGRRAARQADLVGVRRAHLSACREIPKNKSHKRTKNRQEDDFVRESASSDS